MRGSGGNLEGGSRGAVQRRSVQRRLTDENVVAGRPARSCEPQVVRRSRGSIEGLKGFDRGSKGVIRGSGGNLEG
eukprot:4822860-Pyramimonas_sp.AAC.1